jgi:hypothetical protein
MEAAGEIVRLSRCSPYLSAGKKKSSNNECDVRQDNPIPLGATYYCF